MTHLFMGLSPRWIIREPYIPVVNKPPVVKAAALGIRVNPLARVLIFPNIGSYFGGDLIAGILYSEIYQNEKTAILVDVGTNAEVVLGNKQQKLADRLRRRRRSGPGRRGYPHGHDGGSGGDRQNCDRPGHP
jgi:uncharacterized 2Fe-2S/4Fe-4S cluster protein (DUF4445 family)